MCEDGTVMPLLHSMATKLEHQQRTLPTKKRTLRCAPTAVHFTSDLRLQIKKEKFLANRENKQRFINVLSKELEKAGCCCFQASEDADLMIVKTALNSSNKIDTILTGEDTDLLVLLCYHFRQEPFGVFLMSEPKQSTSHQVKIWNIRGFTETLGPSVCSHMLFLHALL